MNLRNKLIFLLAPLIIIPILAVSFVSYDKLYEAAENRLTTHVVTLLEQISRHTINDERVAKANLNILAEHPLLKQYSLLDSESLRYEIFLPSILALFENLQKNNPHYIEVKFITPDGFEDAYWGSVGTDNINESIKKEWYFKELIDLKEKDKSFFILDKNSGEYALLVVHKIFIRNEAVDAYEAKPKIRGYLSLLLSLADLKNEINKNIIGETGFLTVVTSEGIPVLMPSKITMQDINQLSELFTENIVLNNRRRSSSISIDNSLIFAFWRNLTSGTKLVGILPEKDLVNDGYELSKTVFIITLVAIVAAVVLVLASLQFLIIRPLDKLSLAVTKIKNGELDIDININQRDEIGLLANSFLEMSHNLKLSNEVLRVSHQRLKLQRQYSPLAVIEWNVDFELLDCNPAAEHLFGYSRDEVVGLHITDKIFPGGAREMVNETLGSLVDNNEGVHSINENITKDGKFVLCEWHNTPMVDDNGNIIGITSLINDISERQKNEERLRQSQKVDAIGKLTGGVAHDFNNMLGVILGFSELLKLSLSEQSAEQNQYCDEIMVAAERSKKLTSQLLEYARKAPSIEVEIVLNDLLSDIRTMLEKTLTPSIKLIMDLEDNLWSVMTDKSRTESAILNICINSMHAMPEGGELTIRSSTLTLSKNDSLLIDATPGDYVLLSICDTGEGMSEDVQNKIFDPFFTTKETYGSGLGLSQVFGFIEQSRGKIRVSSALGKGTCLDLYFPRFLTEDKNIIETEKVEDKITEMDEPPSGDETILIVDDEEALLDHSELILTSYGYTVLRAESAKEALRVLKKYPVDLMITDVIMPERNGYQLAEEVERLYPKVKIQIVSGFDGENQTSLFNESLVKKRLQKPVPSNDLLITIRNLLDEVSLK